MDKKIPLMIVIGFISIFGIMLIYGNLDDLIFEQIPYYYNSITIIPGHTSTSGSLGGYYEIYGKGKNFKFHVVLPGAEQYESVINGTTPDYDPNGLTGTGEIKSIDITGNTIKSLLNKDFKEALLETKFTGVYNMTCAAWNGSGTFANNGKDFNGTFKIDGPITYFGGNFKIIEKNNQMFIVANYIHHPQGQPDNIVKRNKTFPMN